MTTTPPKNVLPVIDTAISEQKRAIAYSMDLLIPGLYIWLGSFTVRLFGSQPEDEPYKYPGVLNSNYGIALVLPGYRILTTYRNSYDLNLNKLTREYSKNNPLKPATPNRPRDHKGYVWLNKIAAIALKLAKQK